MNDKPNIDAVTEIDAGVEIESATTCREKRTFATALHEPHVFFSLRLYDAADDRQHVLRQLIGAPPACGYLAISGFKTTLAASG